MAHPFMHAVAVGLAGHGIATLRYQFPYMERGSKRPDQPAIAHAAVRAACAEAARLAGGLPLFAGGKSFGGRMTSQAQAIAPLPAMPSRSCTLCRRSWLTGQSIGGNLRDTRVELRYAKTLQITIWFLQNYIWNRFA
jgi:hypothetical protein